MNKLSLLVLLIQYFYQVCLAGDYTCSLSQTCLRDDPRIPFCPDSKKVHNPAIAFFEPAKVKNSIGLMAICPFMNVTEPLCCNDDQVLIMTNAFKQIDSVFGNDVPLCGVNLKKLWCSFTCDPNQANYVKGSGYKQIEIGGELKNLTEVEFMVDEDMACTLFKSCQKVSLIAQASLQSSKSFLDFMGVNGQNQSLSIITFQFDNKTEKREGPMKKCGLNGQVNLKFENQRRLEDQETISDTAIDAEDKNMSQPLDVKVYPCGLEIPANGTIDGYPKLKQASCTFCDEMCAAPDIDASIKFFDGFDTGTVVITYVVMAAVTIVWQLYLYLFKKKKIAQEYSEIVNQNLDELGDANVSKINQTESTQEINPFNLK